MSPAVLASQYLWSIPSHRLRDFQLPPEGKENAVRTSPCGTSTAPTGARAQSLLQTLIFAACSLPGCHDPTPPSSCSLQTVHLDLSTPPGLFNATSSTHLPPPVHLLHLSFLREGKQTTAFLHPRFVHPHFPPTLPNQGCSSGRALVLTQPCRRPRDRSRGSVLEAAPFSVWKKSSSDSALCAENPLSCSPPPREAAPSVTSSSAARTGSSEAAQELPLPVQKHLYLLGNRAPSAVQLLVHLSGSLEAEQQWDEQGPSPAAAPPLWGKADPTPPW